MPSILPRSSWTDTSEGFSTQLDTTRVNGFVIHYPGDGDHIRAGKDFAFYAALLRGYRRYHITTRRWPDIGYCYAITPSGDIVSAAGDRVAAHSATPLYKTANRDKIGVLFILGNKEAPTEQMIAAFKWLRAAKRGKFPNATRLHGHRQLLGASTACPGDATINLINSGSLGGAYVPITPAPAPAPTTPRPRNSHAKREYAPGAVARIQQLLAITGHYTGEIDGDYGPMTASAVTAYQAEQQYPVGGLYRDGDWGPVCDAHHSWVILLQDTLNNWKSARADIREDGDYRDITRWRVREWQSRNHGGAYPRSAALDGLAGPLTCKGLGIRQHP